MTTLTTVTAVAQAVSNVCQVLLSPAGQKLMEKWISDQERFERHCGIVWGWILRKVEATNGAIR